MLNMLELKQLQFAIAMYTKNIESQPKSFFFNLMYIFIQPLPYEQDMTQG